MLCRLAASQDTATLHATLKINKIPQHSGAAVRLTSMTGEVRQAYADLDGKVEVAALPEGAYLLDVVAIGWQFPQFRVDVHPRFDDAIAVAPVASRMPLSKPFELQPLGEAKYYATRKPFNIWGMIMSPYGLMAGARCRRLCLRAPCCSAGCA